MDFGSFNRELRDDLESRGVKFLLKQRVLGLYPADDAVEMEIEGNGERHKAKFMINCAGGEAMDLAHSLGLGLEYTDLHFRGDYWKVGTEFNRLAGRNVYTVPRHHEFPFLDPHWIVKASREVEIGPNAVPVVSPWTYDGFYEELSELFRKLWEQPVRNKAHLLVRPTFLSLALEEALGSISRSFLATRVQRFLPSLREDMLVARGTAGIRSSVIDRRGDFLREVLEVVGPASAHILNYNSPGATGAPAYTVSLIDRLAEEGRLDHLGGGPRAARGPWDFENVREGFS